MTKITVPSLAKFIDDFAQSGGAETANTHLFIERLCEVLALPKPDPAKEQNHENDYVFERSVNFKHPDGTKTKGRIDLYKRNCFILEAKQSSKRGLSKYNPDQHELIPEDRESTKAGTAKRGTRSWDTTMLAARKQAEGYARALPVEHGYPPFLLVADIGHVIEVYADFSGQGKNYAHFPDRQSYRIYLDDIRDEKVQDRLRAIWTAPQTLDPTRISAEVTRDIAARLATIAKRLEKKHDAKEVAEFLMRCLFTMFAEDAELLPRDSFTNLLTNIKTTPKNFKPAMEALWQVMDEGGYAAAFNENLKRFNGSLFKKRTAIALEQDDINELYIAAKRDWRDVEPAIFGTLLERALNAKERSKFGAHYTPRTYVERLVIPTLIEPLRQEWDEVQAHVQELLAAKKKKDAISAVKDYHHRLCTTRVLDPACGTGNFLYVSLELMKKLEGEVLEALESLGYTQAKLGLEGETVNPSQFYGLELNPRAVPIADLVLWIGYLKWQLRTNGLNAIIEPVLHAYGTIKHQDAVLAYDKQQELTDASGKPLTRWDGHTTKLHPITGEEIPDPEAQIPVYSYTNPRPAKWPEAEYIVGNPPFIGGKDMRAELGDGYAEAAWKARPHVGGGADFVMHFWDMAATQLLVKNTKLKRFGFITTNSITQTFSRRVIEHHMAAKKPLSLIYAIPDHPWLKASDKAAVRIAMTVAEAGDKQGFLAKITSEAGLDTDTPQVGLEAKNGKVTAKLRLGANFSSALELAANGDLSSRGVALHGKGFIITPQQATALGLGKIAGLEKHILNYRNGKDITNRPRGVMVIDLYPLEITEVQKQYPSLYQHVLQYVKPERDQNREPFRKQYWWWFGRRHSELRDFLRDMPRYIATVETAKHRFFQFLDAKIRPDNKLVNIGSDKAELLATLSSRVHVLWSIAIGGAMGVGNDPVYVKTKCFDPFPFPDFSQLSSQLQNRLRELGEQLDSFRKERIVQHRFLTMTGLYNVLERERELDNGCDVPPLTETERAIHDAGLILVLKEIHDNIDRATLEAYGWQDLIPALVGKVGETIPSAFKTPEQELAEEELLVRLVALNQERAAEEKQGNIRWLRPEYQIPKLGVCTTRGVTQCEQIEADVTVADIAELAKWPDDGLEQIRIVRDILAKSPSPLAADSIAASFAGRNSAKRKERVAMVLETLVATGATRTDETARYFVPKP